MFSPDEARVLNRLTIGAGSAAPAASTSALRRARAHGSGLEFHEYRHYEPGDDPRSIDWTVEARLRQLVVRVSRSDGHLRVHVLVDASASMLVGAPDKFSCARRLAAALCYVAQERRDVAGVALFDSDVRAHVPPASGRPQLVKAFGLLDGARPSGASNLNRALMHYGAAARGPGLAVVLSDFFTPSSGFDGLQYLLHRGLSPAVVQVVAREELEPDLLDDAELFDIESPSAPTVVVDAGAVAAYKARLAEHEAALTAFCREHGIPFVRIVSDSTFGDMLAALQHAGLLGMYG